MRDDWAKKELKEWSDNCKYNSFNSYKGLAWLESHYKPIANWFNGIGELPAPIELSLDPAHLCNFKCGHCNAQRYLTINPEEVPRDKKIMTKEHLENLVDFCADWGVRGVCLGGGGEPLMNKNVWKLPSYISKKGMESSYATNGSLINEEIANEMMNCMPPDSLIPTKKEVKKIKDVKIGDKVLTLKSGYKPVVRTFKRFVKESLYKIITTKNTLPDSFTSSHEIPVLIPYICPYRKNRKIICNHPCRNLINKNTKCYKEQRYLKHKIIYKKVKDIKINDWLLYPIPQFKEKDINTFAYRSLKVPINEDTLFLMGIYVAEGSVSNGQISISMNKKELHILQKLKDIIEKYDLKGKSKNKVSLRNYKENKLNAGIYWRAKDFGNFLKEIFGCGAANKRIANFIFNLPENKRKSFLRGMLLGDGHLAEGKYLVKGKIKNLDRATYTTISPTLCDQLKRFYLSLGIIPLVSYGHKYLSNRKKDYVISCYGDAFRKVRAIFIDDKKYTHKNRNKSHTFLKIENNYYYALKVKDIKKERYSGYVHNLEVKEDNHYATMSKVVHNCRWVGVSVDSGTPEVFKRVHEVDYFDKVIANLRLLVKTKEKTGSKIDISYKFLITPNNWKDLEIACKLAKDIGVRDFHARPVDLERKDFQSAMQLNYDIKAIHKLFKKCHQIKQGNNFRVFTVMHKYDPEFKVQHTFKNCVSSPLMLQACSNGNTYVCADHRIEKRFELCSHYPNPKEILNFWGSEKHRKLLQSINVDKECGRCTYGEYARQIEELAMEVNEADPMCFDFP